MIQLVNKGLYHLEEMDDASKFLILALDDERRVYIWETAGGIKIRLAPKQPVKTLCTLAAGKYRIYRVQDEPGLASQLHLELLVGEGLWQGFLLPEGWPEDLETKPMVPVEETITKNFTSVLSPT
ncbi:hypothetical protein [Dehalogenimonas alkenigignens]|uniref:Uncharacterized protein n=1 Tax=Dehalogenimonas alkenigignens TaxID=1217799 RepID=A0A0W0GLC4_9CHLR|nr:hypothetical protein [Dehalogenimonas alkenigignens]KTB49339.1 hypothetical protein DEALK_02520 [Dehalogenimonas alkenigignens]